MKENEDKLIPDEDDEFEKEHADLERQRRKALEEAKERAERKRAEQEKEERRQRDKQIAADRIELMKLRNGVIEESETIHEEHEEVRQMTFKEKVANFWYHYKIPVIFAVFILAVIGYILHDEFTRVRPDYTVLMISNNGLQFRQQEMDDFFSKYADDKNGDGKVYVQVMMIPLDYNPRDPTQSGNQSKIMAQIQEGENTLVICDSNTEQVFINMLKHDLNELYPGNKYFAEYGFRLNFQFLAEELKYENMPNDVVLGMRIPTKTLGDSLETMQENFDEQFVIFDKIVKDLTKRAEELNDPGLTTEPSKPANSTKTDSESSSKAAG